MKKLVFLLSLMLAIGICSASAGIMTFPAGIKVIGEEAFRLVAGATELILPEGVERIESKAFAGTSLQNVSLPASLEYIADDAFDPTVYFIVIRGTPAARWAEEKEWPHTYGGETTGLVIKTDWDDTEHRMVITDYTGDDQVIYLPEYYEGKAVYKIADDAFNNKYITHVIFSQNLEEIGVTAFKDCRQLVTLDIPENVKSVGQGAFDNCTSLQSVNLPDCWENIETIPFSGCTALQEVTMSVVTPNSRNLFSGCRNVNTIHYRKGSTGVMPDYGSTDANRLEHQSGTKLSSIDFEEGITHIGNYAFAGPNGNSFALRSVRLPSTLISIGNNAFQYQGQLEEINWPASLRQIDEKAFLFCEKLQTPIFTAGTVQLGTEAFYGCIPNSGSAQGFEYEITEHGAVITKYTGGAPTLTIPSRLGSKTVYRVGDSAFVNNTELTSIVFPSTLQEIGYQAFNGCLGLETVTLPESVKLIGEGAFGNCSNLTKLVLPSTLDTFGANAFFECRNLDEISISVSADTTGAFYGCTKVTVIHYLKGSGVMRDWQSYNSNRLEYYCRNALVRVDFANGVTHIGAHAFGSSAGPLINSVTLPGTLTSIGEYAFSNLIHLEHITLPSGLRSIGDYAFQNCSELTVPALPSSVQLGIGVFDGCKGE